MLFFGYIIFGGIATLVDIGLLYCLTEYVNLWYFYSAFISYMTGMVANYSLNKYYNFKNQSKNILPQFGLFAAVALIGLGLNQVIIYSLVEFVGLWYILAKIISICIVVCWSFYGHKKFTFGLLK
jgi:putative flippase GtrA